MSGKKIAGSTGITAGGSVNFSNVNGQIGIGEHIYQINLIYNDYGSDLKQGKRENIPEGLREQLDIHLSKIKEAEKFLYSQM